MRNGWDPEAFDRWLTAEPDKYPDGYYAYEDSKVDEAADHFTEMAAECNDSEHQSNCRCLVTGVIHSHGRVYPDVIGFGACDTDIYPRNADEKEFEL